MNKITRSILFLAIVALVAVPVAVFASHTGQATGSAQLHPSNQSGIMGNINFTVAENGDLVATGTATGLTFFEDPFFELGEIGGYSLVYENGSRPGGPANPAFDGNCEPETELGLEDMFLGFWLPNPDGSDTWILIQIGGFTLDLSDFNTVSIRIPPVLGAIGVGACGQVADHPG